MSVEARPILFSAPMVRSLVEGRKTQTRRIVKPQPVIGEKGLTSWRGIELSESAFSQFAPAAMAKHCPYGFDLLWVRETWGLQEPGVAGYRATATEDQLKFRKWKPSIHMARKHSRLTLCITDVRVQRLQEISDDDCVAEGVDHKVAAAFVTRSPMKAGHAEKVAFAGLWESINGAGSWDANPWVWALTFEVIPKNVDDVLRSA